MLKLGIWLLGLLAVAVIGAMAVLIVPVIPDPTPGFAARKGELIAVHELGRVSVGETTIVESRLVSSTGLEVEIGVRVPREIRTPLPLVVLLGGLQTGHRAVHLAKRPYDIVFAAVSYPLQGDPGAKGLALMMQLPEMQQALLDTTPAVLLAMDYLGQQPYVDPERVELVGGSLGAFLVSVPGALDGRFRRVWLIHGAGDPRVVFEHQLQQEIAFVPLRKLTARFLALITGSHHLRPEKWVGRIAPRPIIVVNARDDEALPPSSVASLHQALGENAEVIWTEGIHVTPGRTEVVEELVDLLVERIRTAQPAPETPG